MLLWLLTAARTTGGAERVVPDERLTQAEAERSRWKRTRGLHLCSNWSRVEADGQRSEVRCLCLLFRRSSPVAVAAPVALLREWA